MSEEREEREKRGERGRRKRRPPTEDGMLQRLAALCARTEQCEDDLRRKMWRAGLAGEAAERVLERLRELKFLDEGRFAAAYARDKVRFAGWGRNRIRQGLMQKRVGRSDIDAALEGIDMREYVDALKRVALAKARTLDLSCYDDSRKLYAYLLARGFESGPVGKLVDFLRNIEN